MMTIVPLFAFLRFKTELSLNSFKAITSLHDNLFFGLVTVISASCVFDIFLVALMSNRRLNRWYPVGFNMKRMCFFVLSVEDVLEVHLSCKLQIIQNLARAVV